MIARGRRELFIVGGSTSWLLSLLLLCHQDGAIFPSSDKIYTVGNNSACKLPLQTLLVAVIVDTELICRLRRRCFLPSPMLLQLEIQKLSVVFVGIINTQNTCEQERQ